jgi:lysozyme
MWVVGLISVSLVICAGVVAALLYSGILLFNNPSRGEYPVRGVDVSAFQGDIDWAEIKNQDIEFAFIKATEGSSFTDPSFRTNYANATAAGLRVGAYHFFSFDTPGAAQAAHFISEVGKTDTMLPPVIDVELYGNYTKNPPAAEQVRPQLEELISELRTAYGVTPILYATQTSYSLYIEGNFPNSDIWIRNVFSSASLPDNRNWTFWQYTNRGRLHGLTGDERYIDVNVFNGTEDKFAQYGNG